MTIQSSYSLDLNNQYNLNIISKQEDELDADVLLEKTSYTSTSIESDAPVDADQLLETPIKTDTLLHSEQDEKIKEDSKDSKPTKVQEKPAQPLSTSKINDPIELIDSLEGPENYKSHKHKLECRYMDKDLYAKLFKKLFKESFEEGLTCEICKPKSSQSLQFAKMLKNQEKAIKEHVNIYSKEFPTETDSIPFASPLEGLPTLKECEELNSKHSEKEGQSKELNLSFSACSARGVRPSMEDEDLQLNFKHASLTAIFDGHTGKEVSKLCRDIVKEYFSKIHDMSKQDIHLTFTQLLHHIDRAAKGYIDQGSTCLLVYIDKITHLVFTATLGDSEANIYRMFGTQMKSIPLSCLRNWSSEKDAKRAADFYQKPEILKLWKDYPEPKNLRVLAGPNLYNLSRSIEGSFFSLHPISHKPKITMNILKPNDIIVLGCDGLRDYVSETEIINVIKLQKNNLGNIAKDLVNYAIDNNQSKDNVTVRTIVVGDSQTKKSRACQIFFPYFSGKS